MKCEKCGTDVNDTDVYCSNCGILINKVRATHEKIVTNEVSYESDNDTTNTDNRTMSISGIIKDIKQIISKWKETLETDTDWLYFSNLFQHRAKTIIAVRCIQFLFIFTWAISSLEFIIEIINANENLKLLVYVTRYIFNILPLTLPLYIFDTVYELLKVRKSDIKNSANKNSFIFLKVISLVFCCLAIGTISSPTNHMQIAIFAAIATDSILGYILAYGKTLVLLFGSGVVEWIISIIILIDESHIKNKA